jgi:hypothetical protein
MDLSRRRTHRRALALIACSAMLAACSPLAPTSDVREEALRRRQAWRDANIPRYEVNWLLLEGGDDANDRYRSVRVIARSVLDARCPQDRCPEAHLRALHTVDDAFALILDAPADCTTTVQYHETLHIPTWIRIDCADASLPDSRVILRGFQPE